jgi:hypothetical protein
MKVVLDIERFKRLVRNGRIWSGKHPPEELSRRGGWTFESGAAEEARHAEDEQYAVGVRWDVPVRSFASACSNSPIQMEARSWWPGMGAMKGITPSVLGQDRAGPAHLVHYSTAWDSISRLLKSDRSSIR